MEKQINFVDIEYGNRRKVTKREEFLNKMETVIPWGKWVCNRAILSDRKKRKTPARDCKDAPNISFAKLV